MRLEQKKKSTENTRSTTGSLCEHNCTPWNRRQLEAVEWGGEFINLISFPPWMLTMLAFPDAGRWVHMLLSLLPGYGMSATAEV